MTFTEKWNATVDFPGLLEKMGEDLEQEHLEDTPERVMRSWREFLSGYLQDPQIIFANVFEAEGTGLQICRNIEFVSTCIHHCVPFFGLAHIGYVPKDGLAGLSKLSRIVDCYSRRLNIQERMTQQIADAIQEYLDPIGVLVITKAHHLCCMGRGINRMRLDYVCSAQHGEIESSLYHTPLGGA